MQNNLPTYTQYKPSGVQWLGNIPEHWKLTRLGTRFEERRTKVSDKDYPALSVTKQGILPQLDSAAKTNDGDNRKLVKAGDFVINSRSDRKGSSGISDRDGSVSLINIVMEPHNVHPIYCNYLLKSYAFVEEFYRMGHGIVADLWTTRYDEMKAIMVGIPPLPEQTAIAQFLDRKTAQIDVVIAQKQRMIELLKEHRQITINNCLIRGTNPSEKLKDSGIKQIGLIPHNWEIRRLKHCVNILTGFAFKSTMYSNSPEDIKLLRGININPDSINWSETVYWPQKHKDQFKEYLLQENDIVIGMDRPWVSSGIRVASISHGDLPCLLLQRVARIRGNSTMMTQYSKLLLSSKIFLEYFEPMLSGISVPHISSDQITNFQCPVPPVEEQTEIVNYIETATQKIDKAIGLKEQEIEKLKEYKASLINSVVTGKVKVVE